ncbi:MAG: hypothetical protein ACXVDJ_07365, partial [Tumebacillaceae bacterium]
MKMSRKPMYVWASATLALAMLLAGCDGIGGSSQTVAEKRLAAAENTSAKYTQAAKDLGAELAKGNENGGKVDWIKAMKLYTDNLESFVKALDQENRDNVNQSLVTAFLIGQDGGYSADVSEQLYEGLMEKAFYSAMMHDLKKANEEFAKKEDAKADIAEAQGYFIGYLKDFVSKQDTAYST